MKFSVLFDLAFASQIGIGIVFFLSVLPKLRRPLAFARSVVEYKILPLLVAQRRSCLFLLIAHHV